MSENEIDRLKKELEQERREKEEAKAREEEAKAREERERRKNQNTTLEEYLHNCHVHLYRNLILADTSRSSTGFTRVDGKYYPKWLRPWHDFEKIHRRRHFEAIKAACKERRLFHQETTTRNIGSSIFRRRAGDENAIGHFEKLAVEDPVWEILRPVWDVEDLRQEYRCSDVRFSNNRRDVTADWSEGGGLDRASEMASEQRVKPSSTKPDGWGVRAYPGGGESHAFVFDYKAAHKVSAASVNSTVAKERLFMEVMQRICSDKTGSNSAAREHEKTEEVIAMALTQVFDYMVRYGVAYGYVAAGASLILLHVDRADLQTLYCHACVPEEDVGGSPSGGLTNDKVMYTAVAQLASFCLLSLQSDALRGALLEKALQIADAILQTWGEPYADAVCVPEVENTESSSAPSSQGTGSRYTSSVSPINRKISLRSKSSCRSTDVFAKGDEEDEEPDDGPTGFRSRVDASKRKDGPSSSSSEGEGAEMSSSVPARQYCTQACLLGLKRHRELDDNCPNVRSHRAAEGGDRHPIDADTFTRLMREQLRQSPYRKCDALDGWGKGGAVGMLFKLELEPYGYTFVGKGALSGHPRDLEHESNIYARLDQLQGYVVPVHLGMVELDWGYILAGGVRVFDMMLMSWGGEKASKAGLPNLATELRRSLQAVWAEGVDHGDERGDNQLWNEERRQVMIIDFDRATLFPKPRNKRLLEVSGNKRKRNRDGSESSRKRLFLQDRAQAV
ncbi:hypothetical protein E5D57_013211 [Metarhizium anisopliae]|nr:hypothetical protein E5D57_013211 [Metarhizium anisopliae]